MTLFCIIDDFVLYYRGTGINVIERQLQPCINGIHRWSVLNGLKFPKAKTICMHFCQLRRMYAEPELTIDGDPIKVVEETQFLGLTFYTKLSFIPDIKYDKRRCQKALDILWVLSSSEWAADRCSALRVPNLNSVTARLRQPSIWLCKELTY